MKIKDIIKESSDQAIKIPTEDGITMQDIRLMAGEGKLTKKTVLQAIAVIRKQRRDQNVTEDSDPCWDNYEQVGMKKGKGGKQVPDCRGPIKEQGVAEGSDAEAYKQKLLSSLPQMMRFYEKNLKGWKPSKEQMLAAVETGYTVMKHTGDVKQAGKAVMDELNTLHRMSQGQQGVAEGSGESYIIVRTNSEGKKDVFAGNFDTYERAQKELDACLAHPLHTKYKQKFEIKRKGQQGMTEGSMKPTEVTGKEKPGAVKMLELALNRAKDDGKKLDYGSIDRMMQLICRKYNLTGDKLHDDFVDKHDMTPDKWIKQQDDTMLEETYDDDDEFFESYGVIGYNTESLLESEYQGHKVTLNKPMQGDVKKFRVYVKNEKGNVVKVNFGDKNSTIKKNNPARRKSFRARHRCETPGPKTSAKYWSCRNW